MSFAGKVWRLLVGIKDGLVLLFLLLFFSLLFAALTARPNPGVVREGALLLTLDGSVVEEATEIDPLQVLLDGKLPASEYEVGNLVRALDAAARDERIKAVVLDLTMFLGGGQVHMQELGAALDRVRAADKPVLTFALAYSDDAMTLAAHSSEVWVDPLGGAMIMGPGGDRLYYKNLLDKLDINVRVYRVGTYKSAVEPYLRSDMSPEAREAASALYATLWEEWQADVKKARPNADLDRVTKDTVAWMQEYGGDSAKAAKAAGLVDQIGDWAAFGAHVAEIAGPDKWSNAPGAFTSTDLAPWLAANKPDTSGKAIGVITIAGEITDGDAGPGTAGGHRIARLLDDALDDDLAALVVRVDSPGGTVSGAEEIRRAILRHKAKGIPIAVSMANYAASGGYWVSAPADRIFAEPETITGSIGVFATIPTFEKVLSTWGVGSDGVQTTPLSGQPDFIGGFTPETDALLQSSVEHIYDRFTGLVAQGRKTTKEDIDKIGQGRVWDGGTARQLGLVDQFGNLDNALEWASKEAGLSAGQWHARPLHSPPDPYTSMIQQMISGSAVKATPPRDMFAMASLHQQKLAQRLATDLQRMTSATGAQAYCLECAAPVRTSSAEQDLGLVKLLGLWLSAR